MWFYIALFAGLASALDKVINRVALKNQNNVLAYSFLYIGLMATIALFFSLPFPMTLPVFVWVLIIAQTIVWAISTLSSFMSQSTTDVSLSMIIARSRMLWVLPFSFLFLQERITIYTILGTVTIFSGFLVLLYKEKNSYLQRSATYGFEQCYGSYWHGD